MNVAFVGLGSTEITRRSDRGITALAIEAAHAALVDAGLGAEDIDGYIGAPTATAAGSLHSSGGDEITIRPLVEQLGLSQLKFGVDLSKAFPTDMVIVAAQALQSGACNYVLGVRALYNLSLPKQQSTGSVRAYGNGQFTAPFALDSVGARFAMRARAYLERSGATRSDLFRVVELSRRNAGLNPLAVWRDRPVSLEQYLAAPMIAAPFGQLDCDMPVCGAAAFVMTRGDLVTASHATCAYLAGWSRWSQAERIFERSGIERTTIDVCQLYDGFSFMLYEWLERLGWCAPDTAWRFIAEGRGGPEGDLPLNTFGGSLGEGRLHGMGHLREAILQMSHRAGPRQIASAEHCLVQVGPFDSSSLLVLSAEPPKMSE
jgi:acetyl-CoA acetyltransferase